MWNYGLTRASHIFVSDQIVAKLFKCLNEIETKIRDHKRNQSHAKAMEMVKQLLEQKMEAAIKKKS